MPEVMVQLEVWFPTARWVGVPPVYLYGVSLTLCPRFRSEVITQFKV